MSEKVKKERKNIALASENGGGVAALIALAREAPKAPTASERLAAARKARMEEIHRALTPEVYEAIGTLRAKGYGWSVVASTVSKVLNVKISANALKSLMEAQPAVATAQSL